MSDRIVVMNRGRIEQTGTPNELYHRSVNEFVADFIGQSNLLPCTVVASDRRHCRVKVGDGLEIVVDAEKEWQPGAAGVVVVRPEDTEFLRPDRWTTPNQFPAVVEVVAFVGDSTKYTVRLDAGARMNVRVQRNTIGFRQSDRVTVAWQAMAARLIERSHVQSS